MNRRSLNQDAHPPGRFLMALCVGLLVTLPACGPVPCNLPAQSQAEPSIASRPESPPSQAQPPAALAINRDARTLDLAARMVNARPEWLELIATTQGSNSRDHEAIVTITAQPSEVHLALLTLGLEPGRPLVNKHVDGVFRPDPPTGPQVRVYFVYEIDGQTVQTPAHEWVIHEATGEPLPDAPWLFTGSQFRRWQGKDYYMADENGNAISLVNFGDDLIVRQTETTQNNDGQELQLNEDNALPYGTPLTLRIKVTPPPAPAETGQPADAP